MWYDILTMARSPRPSLFAPPISEVRAAVAAALAEVQEASGKAMPELTDSTCPLTDLPDFDSLSSLEAVVLLSTRLAVEFGHGFSPFVDEKTGRPADLAAIVRAVAREVGAGPKETL